MRKVKYVDNIGKMHGWLFSKNSSETTFKRQRGRVVSASDSQYSGPGDESRSEHYLDLSHGSPEFKSSAALVNDQSGLPPASWDS